MKNQTGFTLIEIVMVIVILGILGVAGADFISTAFKGFSQADARMDLYEEGKMALVRMERELRNVVPYAINPPPALPAAHILEFGMIDETAMQNVFGRYTETPGDFPTKKLNDVYKDDPSPPASWTPDANWTVSVYNMDWANDFAGGGRLFDVNSVQPISKEMRFSSWINESSPRQRYYVVDKVVKYGFSGTTLYRLEGDVSEAAGIVWDTPPLGFPGYPLSEHVSSLAFKYSPGTLTRNGLVVIDMTLKKDDEEVDFHKEIHIRNVP